MIARIARYLLPTLILIFAFGCTNLEVEKTNLEVEKTIAEGGIKMTSAELDNMRWQKRSR